MRKKQLTCRGLKVGDLVYHMLYGREWVGVILEIKSQEKGLASPRQLALIQMQPNTRYSLFFEKNGLTKNKVNDSMGYVSSNWLFKLEEKAKGKV